MEDSNSYPRLLLLAAGGCLPFMNIHHFNESNPFNMTSVHKLVQCQCCSGLRVSGEVHQDHLQQPTLSLRGFAVSRSLLGTLQGAPEKNRPAESIINPNLQGNQSSIINHQSSIINHNLINPS